MKYTLPEPEIALAWCSWTEAWEVRDMKHCLGRKEDDRIIGYTETQMQAAFDAGRASRDAEIEALRADAECFRYWVHEAWHSPGDMARLLATCETADDYRNKIIPVMKAAKAATDAAQEKTND